MAIRVGSPGYRLQDVRLEQSYSSASHDLVSDFYVPCLSASRSYDRAVGYFRSSLFAVVGVALSDFALRGGHFRLVCSPHLSRSDILAIEQGLDLRVAVEGRLKFEIEQVLKIPENRPVVSLLASLVASGAMDIKLAFRPHAAGMFHAKVGIFDDAAETVTFVGSANETFSAWDSEGNHETFEVFRSWTDEQTRVLRHRQYFDRLWKGQEAGVDTRSLPDVPRETLMELASPIDLEKQIDEIRKIYVSRSTRRGAHSGDALRTRKLFPHQSAAFGDWLSAGYRGLLKHATGSGKTITALAGVQHWVNSRGPALIVVPSDILARQWRKEAASELQHDVTFLDAGAGFGAAQWQGLLADYTRDLRSLGPRVTIATMQTASTPLFTGKVQQGRHLLLVVDEVHRVGSPKHRSLLCIDAGGRLGLSATPERYGDHEGTHLIFDYFGKVLEPQFGLSDAIRVGRLVPYDYHVHQVILTPDEQEHWDELTERIKATYARLPSGTDGEKVMTNSFKLLLIDRARIIKQASGKARLALDLISSEMGGGDRWLVYCDDQVQLREVLETLCSANYPAYEYHSSMIGGRSETLEYFEEHGGILVAIRCLDEGVDIPAVNRALILASSSNPREFIQRRGRVLRVAPGKYSAAVHDAIVLPLGEFAPGDPQAGQARTEIRRALQFAENARNTAVKHELEMIARRMGLERIVGIEFDYEPEEDGGDAPV